MHVSPEKRYCLACLRFGCEHIAMPCPPRDAVYLSPREVTVLRTLAERATDGRNTNKQIGAALNITEGTVKIYLTKSRLKIRSVCPGIWNRTSLVIWALGHVMPEKAMHGGGSEGIG